MTSQRQATVEDALKTAETAMRLAAEARSVVHVYGKMFEALLNILKNNASVLTQSQVKGVFLVAATMIDAMTPTSGIEQTAQAGMREMLCRIAQNSGIEIPPPGQTGVLRKQ